MTCTSTSVGTVLMGLEGPELTAGVRKAKTSSPEESERPRLIDSRSPNIATGAKESHLGHIRCIDWLPAESRVM